MNIRRKNRITSEVSTSSLNDIMFFLLLFFLIVSTMANPSVIKVLLPKAQTSTQVTKKQVNLSINKDMQYFIDKRQIPADELKPELADLVGTNTDLTVVLRIDSEVQWKDAIEVLDIGKELNIKMVVATRKK
jgi:biopolymer transport protein ExbD